MGGRGVLAALFAAIWILVLPVVDGRLHAHIIGHSHCDPGWLDTFEQYYQRDVSQIISNVFSVLSRDPKKKFVWSESSYFQRWYESQSTSTKEAFKLLVYNGQLEFVGGGWSQNDEANPDAITMINQMTEGHQYLLRNFGVQPRVGWQIDPFGHSAVTPSLMALMGFDALVINRIHFNVKTEFKNRKHMEFMWRGVDVGANASATMFTHVLHTHYSAPRGFDWEEGSGVGVNANNVRERAKDLSRQLHERMSAYRTNQLLVPWGDDFKFRNAQHQFSQMDQIINEVMSRPDEYDMTISYSTLSDYFKAVHQEAKAASPAIAFPVYGDDFFPYADNGDSYWTGFYTTRPVMKAVSRRVEYLLRASEMLHALVRSHPRPASQTNALAPVQRTFWEQIAMDLSSARQDHALFLHHDAITGTCKSTVFSDYMARMNDAAAKLLKTQRTVLQLAMSKTGALPPFTENPYTLTANDKYLYPLVLFNSLAWPRRELISIRVSTLHVWVFDAEGRVIPSQLDPVWPDVAGTETTPNLFSLHFLAQLPALGASTVFIKVLDRADPNLPAGASLSKTEIHSTSSALTSFFGLRGGSTPTASDMIKMKTADPGSPVIVETQLLRVEFGSTTGLIQTLTDKRSGVNVNVQQKFFEYHTSRSGAYIFRPQERASEIRNTKQGLFRVTRGDVVSTVAHKYQDFDVAVTVVHSDDPEVAGFVGLQHSVTASTNQELVIRFSTSLQNGQEFHTHNGMQFIKRQRVNDPIPANFYPMVTGMRMADTDNSRRVTMWSDHTMGCGSQATGEVEFMVHRSLNQDDGRGLGQGVVDTSRVEVPLWLAADKPSQSPDDTLFFRRISLRMNNPVQMVYGAPGGAAGVSASSDDNTVQGYQAKFLTVYQPLGQALSSASSEGLPPDVHLLTLAARDSISDDVILRLQSLVPSTNWQLPVSSLFSSRLGYKPSQLRATTLTANQELPVSIYPKPRLTFAADTDSGSGGSLWGFIKGVAAHAGGGTSGERQNTDEEGVFISQAALDGKAAGSSPTARTLQSVETADGRASVLSSSQGPWDDASPTRRRLLEASDDVMIVEGGDVVFDPFWRNSGVLTVNGMQIRSYMLSLLSSQPAIHSPVAPAVAAALPEPVIAPVEIPSVVPSANLPEAPPQPLSFDPISPSSVMSSIAAVKPSTTSVVGSDGRAQGQGQGSAFTSSPDGAAAGSGLGAYALALLSSGGKRTVVPYSAGSGGIVSLKGSGHNHMHGAQTLIESHKILPHIHRVDDGSLPNHQRSYMFLDDVYSSLPMVELDRVFHLLPSRWEVFLLFIATVVVCSFLAAHLQIINPRWIFGQSFSVPSLNGSSSSVPTKSPYREKDRESSRDGGYTNGSSASGRGDEVALSVRSPAPAAHLASTNGGVPTGVRSPMPSQATSRGNASAAYGVSIPSR